MTVVDLTKALNWSGGREWTDVYGERSSPNDGYCEIENFALEFEFVPNAGKYIFWISELIGFKDDDESNEILEMILPPGFAETEEAAKHRAILALINLLTGPRLIG